MCFQALPDAEDSPMDQVEEGARSGAAPAMGYDGPV